MSKDEYEGNMSQAVEGGFFDSVDKMDVLLIIYGSKDILKDKKTIPGKEEELNQRLKEQIPVTE